MYSNSMKSLPEIVPCIRCAHLPHDKKHNKNIGDTICPCSCHSASTKSLTGSQKKAARLVMQIESAIMTIEDLEIEAAMDLTSVRMLLREARKQSMHSFRLTT